MSPWRWCSPLSLHLVLLWGTLVLCGFGGLTAVGVVVRSHLGWCACLLPLFKAEMTEFLEEMLLAKSGLHLFQWLVNVHNAHCGLFPLQVQSSQSNHIDRYLACGKNYRVLRDAVGKAMIECKTEGLLEAEKVGHAQQNPVMASGWLVFKLYTFVLPVSPVEIFGLIWILKAAVAYRVWDTDVCAFVVCVLVYVTLRLYLVVASSLLLYLLINHSSLFYKQVLQAPCDQLTKE